MSTDSSIHLRPARPADRDVIAEYNRSIARETEGHDLAPETITAGVARILEDSNLGFYTVACSGERVVGQAMITYEWSDWRNGMIWWFQSVYVHPDFRRQGIFKSLCEDIVRRAREAGDVVGLRLYVESHNERARATYRSLGIVDAGYEVMEMIPLS